MKLISLFAGSAPTTLRQFDAGDDFLAVQLEHAFQPSPLDRERDACAARCTVLTQQIKDFDAEIARMTELRDEHIAILAGEEAKQKAMDARMQVSRPALAAE